MLFSKVGWAKRSVPNIQLGSNSNNLGTLRFAQPTFYDVKNQVTKFVTPNS